MGVQRSRRVRGQIVQNHMDFLCPRIVSSATATDVPVAAVDAASFSRLASTNRGELDGTWAGEGRMPLGGHRNLRRCGGPRTPALSDAARAHA
jgi:hypothetical protein